MIFLYISGYFMLILSKTAFSEVTTPNPMRNKGCQNKVLCVHLGISCTSIKIFPVKMPLISLPMGVVVT